MNNFATLISCPAVVHTWFLEMRLINITSLAYQDKVSQQCTFNLHQSNIPHRKALGIVVFNIHIREIRKNLGMLKFGKL
jgi:hypothetical protein